MKHLRSIIVIFSLFLFRCSNNSPKDHNHLFTTTNNKVATANPKNLNFTYEIDSIHPSMDGHIVDVSCNIYNGNNDTLYFYTHTCFGWEDNFIIDPKNVNILRLTYCVFSNPVVKKLAPEDYFDFKGHFYVKGKDPSKLDLHYFIYQVDSGFDPSNQEITRNLKKTVISNTSKKHGSNNRK